MVGGAGAKMFADYLTCPHSLLHGDLIVEIGAGTGCACFSYLRYLHYLCSLYHLLSLCQL